MAFIGCQETRYRILAAVLCGDSEQRRQSVRAA